MIEREACNKFYEDSGIIWDLKEDRMICPNCYADELGVPHETC